MNGDEGGSLEEVGLELNPKSGRGFEGGEDDELVENGVLGLGARIIDGTLGVGGVDGDDGDVVGIVVLIGAESFECVHVLGFVWRSVFGVGDDGIRLSHGDPGEEEVAVTVDASGVTSTSSEVDAAAKVADIGVLGWSLFL